MLIGKPDRKNYLKDPEVDVCGFDSSGSGQSPVADSCKLSNELSDSINGRAFVDRMSNYQFINDKTS
jgi:hypothetical protein